MSLRIWWLTDNDIAAIGPRLEDKFPDYIWREYLSRSGRTGRGRLWAAARFGDVKCEWADTPLGKVLEWSYGGIVILAADVGLVRDLPGLVTDLNLKRVC